MGNLVKVIILLACIYAFVKWESISPQGDETSEIAKRNCVQAIDDRFSAQSVSAYAVEKKAEGYVVRATTMLGDGNSAKVYCLSNKHGGVEDIRIVEN